MKVLQITIFVVVFAEGILGQYDNHRNAFNAPKSIERGFAPVNSYFEKDSSSSSSYENPSYGHPNSNYQQPPQILFMPQAQALTAEPPQYGPPQVPEAISNYLATVAQKYGGPSTQNFQDPTKQGPQVFVPPQMQKQSPFQAPDQYQFVPPDLQSFQQPTHQYQQAPVQFNQPEFANIQPAVPQYPQDQYQNQQSHNQQPQFQNQQSQYQNQQSQYQNSQSLYLNQQPSQVQYQNQQPQYPNHQPQYSQEQSSQPIQVSYQRPENLGHLPPITKNPNDIVNSEMYSEGGQSQNRAPPTKYVKGSHFIDVGNLGEYNEFGNDFEGGYNHFGGFNGFESGKYGGFDGGKFGSFSSFDNSFEDSPSSALTSFKLGTKPKGTLKLSGSVGSSKRTRYNRGGSIAGIRRPTRFVLSS
ncbi:vacuolar protein-sorting-associated protein 36-like [Onthophagus taurus]|uniref:vacuolar protein-sorting-associated protein 36-like n=1 Tax=Onthophagus taurus TaxID=166361 RepID=UPI0039BE2BEE